MIINFGKYIIPAITLFFICLTSISCSVHKNQAKSTQNSNIEYAILSSAKYLQNSVKENGMFEYRVNTDPSVTVKPKYNILRHSGTIYAMSQYLELYPQDRKMHLAIERAGRYLQSEAIGPVEGKNEMLAVWSRPEVNNSGRLLEAKLGGTGLGLVALLSIEKFHPGFTPLSNLKKLGNFIIYMQKEDGSFYSKYIPSQGGRSDKWQSLYYPGEAAFGLLMLYEKDGSKLWAESAYKALKYIAEENYDKAVVDHWYLIATEKLLSFNDLDLTQPQKDLLTDHAARICEKILQEQIIAHQYPEFRGGFSRDGRITPSSIRLEGLLAARSLFSDEYKELFGVDRSIKRGIQFLLKAQIKDGDYVGAFPRALRKIDGTSENVIKFNDRVTEIRIDYAQHALSAMIGYLNLLNNNNKVTQNN